MKINFKNIITIPKVMGVNLLLENNEITTYSYCILEFKKGEVLILENRTVEHFEDIPLETDLPIVLNLSGNNIISKRIKHSNLSELEAFNSVLPSAKTEDFLIQNYHNEHTFCSLVRLETIQQICSIFEAKNIYILNLSLNHFAIANCYFLLNNLQKINLANFIFHFEDNSLLNIQTSNLIGNYTIDTKEFNSYELSAFAVAFQFLVDKESEIKVSNFLEETKAEFQQKIIFDKVKVAIPLFFLVILLINFLIFSFAQEKNNVLVQKVQNNQQILNQLDSLKAEVNAKEKFLNKEQWFSHSRTSFYADRIAYSLPLEITLQNLEIYPLKETDSNEELTYENNFLEITGYSKSALILNAWTKKLKNETWIDEIEIIDYQQKKSTEDIWFHLFVNLKIKKNV